MNDDNLDDSVLLFLVDHLDEGIAFSADSIAALFRPPVEKEDLARSLNKLINQGSIVQDFNGEYRISKNGTIFISSKYHSSNTTNPKDGMLYRRYQRKPKSESEHQGAAKWSKWAALAAWVGAFATIIGLVLATIL